MEVLQTLPVENAAKLLGAIYAPPLTNVLFPSFENKIHFA
jgi:hypothetical protein